MVQEQDSVRIVKDRVLTQGVGARLFICLNIVFMRGLAVLATVNILLNLLNNDADGLIIRLNVIK